VHCILGFDTLAPDGVQAVSDLKAKDGIIAERDAEIEELKKRLAILEKELRCLIFSQCVTTGSSNQWTVLKVPAPPDAGLHLWHWPTVCARPLGRDPRRLAPAQGWFL
jgi:hypothetical protein